ncbi:MAG: M56 family metallopeptidase [Nanoarchaeota archaeon]
MNLADLIVIFAQSPTYVMLTILTLLSAFIVLVFARRKTLPVTTRVFLIYVHLALLVVPVALFAYSSGCAMPMVDCTWKTTLYAAPFILLGLIATAGIIGYFVLPRMYSKNAVKSEDNSLLRFIKHHSTKHNLKTPELFLVDSRVPMAFSFSAFKPSMYLSIGLMDLLERKELEAVILHEIGHLHHKSALLKFSSHFVRWFSPIAHFGKNTIVDEEEHIADVFAIDAQGTDKYLTAAYEKVR